MTDINPDTPIANTLEMEEFEIIEYLDWYIIDHKLSFNDYKMYVSIKEFYENREYMSDKQFEALAKIVVRCESGLTEIADLEPNLGC